MLFWKYSEHFFHRINQHCRSLLLEDGATSRGVRGAEEHVMQCAAFWLAQIATAFTALQTACELVSTAGFACDWWGVPCPLYGHCPLNPLHFNKFPFSMSQRAKATMFVDFLPSLGVELEQAAPRMTTPTLMRTSPFSQRMDTNRGTITFTHLQFLSVCIYHSLHWWTPFKDFLPL